MNMIGSTILVGHVRRRLWRMALSRGVYHRHVLEACFSPLMMEVNTNHGAAPLLVLFPGCPKECQGGLVAAIFRVCAALGSS